MVKEKVMFLNHSNVTSGNVVIWEREDPLAAAQTQAGRQVDTENEFRQTNNFLAIIPQNDFK